MNVSAQDPYRFLESLDSKKSTQWVDAQNARTAAAWDNTATVQAMSDKLTALYTSKDRIVNCSRYGDWGYNTWTDEKNPLGLVRRTPWQAWLDGKPEWQTILDVDAMEINHQDDDETRWTLADFQLRYPDYERALVSLAPDGSDACIVLELDIASGEFIEDGFELYEPGQHSINWIGRDSVYVAWDDSADNDDALLTDAGHPRQVRRWERGQPLSDAPVVFECAADDISASAWFDGPLQRHMAARNTGMWTTEWFWHDGKSWQQYAVAADAEIAEWDRWLFVTLRSDWRPAGQSYVCGSLLVIDRESFLQGARDFQLLFTPGVRSVLVDFDFTRHYTIVSERHDCIPRVVLWTPPSDGTQGWSSRTLTLQPGMEAEISSVDSTRDDTVLIHVDHFLVPTSLYHSDLSNNAPWHLLARLTPQFDASGMTAELLYASAPDGVQIPYWLIGKPASEGPAPCLLYGYGGFEEALDEAGYIPSTAITWLKRGGRYAIACIRGGGEFGPAWHQAALREKRQVAFDDFIVVAETLIAGGVTTDKQLGISGGSNGGLLVARCMVQRPDLFGAVVAAVPVLDMARFHKLLQGATWIDEYGNPDDPQDLRYLLEYSPYHTVKSGISYPPVLFTTTTSDDRVHPAHARKMAALMQEQGHQQAWYLERRDGGHGAGVDARTMAHAEAVEADFLWRNLTR